nr:vegetative cell wall protein gp1-like [Ipomoea batatas]
MANQQQPRPLFRFASMSPVPAPSPPLRALSPPSPPPPQPKPAVTLSPPPPSPTPTRSPIMGFGQRSPASVTPPPPISPPPPPAASPRMPSPAYSPAVKQSPPPPAAFPTRITSSVPTSPVQKPITEFTSYSPKPKVQSPPKPQPQPFQDYYNPPPKPASPVRAPPPSPKTFEKTPQMSPLKLPKPAQTMSDSDSEPKIPIDQKKMVVQETTQRSRGYIPPIRHHPHENKQNEADEYGMSVLTLAGENKGAIMDLSPARKKYNGFNGTPQKLQSDAEKSGSGSDNESRPKYPNGTRRRSLPMTAFMNSNVQSINNSILHNTTCNHHDPGIHLIFSGKEGFKPHYPKGSPNTR